MCGVHGAHGDCPPVISHLARLYIDPSSQYQLIIKQQIPLRLPLTHQQQRIDGRISSRRTGSEIIESGKVGIAQDIHIMNQYRRLRIKQWQRFLNATARLQQPVALV